MIKNITDTSIEEVVKEFLLNPNAMYLEAEEIYKKYQK